MNDKDTNKPIVIFLPDHSLSSENQPFSLCDGNIDLKQFVSHYCGPIYSAITRLSGVSDQTLLENLTGNVLHCLWNNRVALSKEKSSGIFIFKILLQYVFSYLKNVGNEDRILFLRNCLHINPDCYLHIIEPSQKPFRAISQSYLSTKIKKIWKTF
jgi:hypothetical protein